jgi:hypothetical protein
VFQECTSTMISLITQLVTNYYEENDVNFVSIDETDLAKSMLGTNPVAASRLVGNTSASRVDMKAKSKKDLAIQKGLISGNGNLSLSDQFLDEIITNLSSKEKDPQATAMIEYSNLNFGLPLIPLAAATHMTPITTENLKLASPQVLKNILPIQMLGTGSKKGLLSLPMVRIGEAEQVRSLSTKLARVHNIDTKTHFDVSSLFPTTNLRDDIKNQTDISQVRIVKTTCILQNKYFSMYLFIFFLHFFIF